MILLDPDLHSGSRANLRSRTNSGLRSGAGAAKRHAGRKSSENNLLTLSARALAPFLKRAQAAVRLRGEVTVLLTTDAALRKLNRRFRGKNKATDVLSFPANALFQSQEKGDLAISVETARRQGAACGHSLATEIKILMLHGLLHLKGFDHESDDGQMAREEQRLRVRLGLAQGLIERVAPPALATGTSRKVGARGASR
jgi:probable rRNA maturation factor